MRRFFPAAALALAVLGLGWVSAPAAPTPSPVVLTPEGSAAIDALAPLAAAVDQQAERLRERLASAPQPPVPRRDPFSFGARRPEPTVPPAAPVEPAVVDVADAPASEVLLWPALVAVVSNDAAEGRRLTAVLAWGDAMDLLESGGLAGDFRVESVAPDSVELRHVASGVVRRLTLR